MFPGLENIKNYLGDIIESLSDGIFITDAEGKVLLVNQAWESICGFSREDMLGRYANQLVDDGCWSISPAMEAIKQGKRVSLFLEILKGGNTGKKLWGTATPIYDGDKLMVVVDDIRDVSELIEVKKRLEESKEFNRECRAEMEKLVKEWLNREIIYKSKAMERVVELARNVAGYDMNVLITGESGVGKDAIARFIHAIGPRSSKPMQTINCGAIPRELLESELFGYEGGAFTGARKSGKPGLFEVADNGTLFLDEIGDMPMDLQVKLLRILERGELRRVGGTKTVNVDVRIIAATNEPLEEMADRGMFRKDLYYRLNVVNIYIPPLRERREDIFPLVVYYLDRFNEKYNRNKSLNPEAIDMLINYDWPGNIRELINLIERLVITAKEENITKDDLLFLSNIDQTREDLSVNRIMSIKEAKRVLEKKLIEMAMSQCHTTRDMARALDIDQSCVVRKIKLYGLK